MNLITTVMCIFFLCCHTTSQMSLTLIHRQYLLHSFRQLCINCWKSFLICQILVHCGLANSKCLCRLSHCCLILDYVLSHLYGSLFNISFQKNIPCIFCLYILCKGYLFILFYFVIYSVGKMSLLCFALILPTTLCSPVLLPHP